MRSQSLIGQSRFGFTQITDVHKVQSDGIKNSEYFESLACLYNYSLPSVYITETTISSISRVQNLETLVKLKAEFPNFSTLVHEYIQNNINERNFHHLTAHQLVDRLLDLVIIKRYIEID